MRAAALRRYATEACALTALLLGWHAASLADTGLAGFAHRIELALTPGAALYCVELPIAVHQGTTRADLADLKVFNAAGEPVPFAFAANAAPASVAVRQAMPLFPLHAQGQAGNSAALDLQIRQNPDGTLVRLTAPASVSTSMLQGYLIDAGVDRHAIQAIELDWTRSDEAVNTRVNIDASEDLKQWRRMVAGAPVLDLSFAGQRLRQNEIKLDRLQSRYLRLEFVGTPVELSKVSAALAPQSPEPQRRTIEVAGNAVAGRPLEYQFDLGAAVTTERIGFVLPEQNTVAPAELLARDGEGGAWRTVANTVVYRIAGAGGELASPPMSIVPTAARYWLLRVNPASGGIGAGVPRMHAAHLPRHLVFVARGSGPFVLAYGQRERAGEKSRVAATALPLASLIPDYRAGAEWALQVARAGTPVVNNPAALEPRWSDRLDLRKLALWALLSGAVLVLALMAWRLARQINKRG